MNKRQHDNCQILLSVIQDKIDNDDPMSMLDKWFQPCGTCGCIAGDTYIKMFDIKEPILVSPLIEDDGLPADEEIEYLFLNWKDDYKYNFGLEIDKIWHTFFSVFGNNQDFSYQDRIDYINSQIEELYEQRTI